MDAAEYLRKSRMEEGMDTEEVLSKHRSALAKFAAEHDIHIIETFREVVSGESLYARPEMLRLLQEVEEGRFDAVLVMDLDRLSRGRMKDQGIILDAFRDSGTLIVTPEKTYDLSDDLDDEMAEFKTFMSRREYKIINKRLRRGLAQTIVDGLHPAIISREQYDRVQEIMGQRYIPPSNDGTIRSPLAGLVRCSKCGKNMQRMGANKGVAYLLCNTKGCCAGAKFDLVEQAVLSQLGRVLAQLSVEKPAVSAKSAAGYTEARLAAVQKELAAAEAQKGRLYDLLEQGVYDVPTFRERMEAAKARLSALEKEVRRVQRELEDARQADPASLAAKISAVLDAYGSSDAAHRNALLRSVLRTVWYTKEKKTKPADFDLQLDLVPY